MKVPDTPAELFDENGEVIPAKPIALFGVPAGGQLPRELDDFLYLNGIPYDTVETHGIGQVVLYSDGTTFTDPKAIEFALIDAYYDWD